MVAFQAPKMNTPNVSKTDYSYFTFAENTLWFVVLSILNVLF